MSNFKWRLPQKYRANSPVVIKLSSLAVTSEKGGLDLKKVRRICEDLAELYIQNVALVLVSSGSINAGRIWMNEIHKEDIRFKQASAAIGQPILINAYSNELDFYNIPCAQILLTHEDIKNRKRFYNSKNTIEYLLEKKVIPIINENDSVSFDEITSGDNDQLAAQICEMLQAQVLIMLTKTDGVFLEKDAAPIGSIGANHDLDSIPSLESSSTGRGGIKTKLQAVRKLTPLGTGVLISSFDFRNPILRVLKENVGSYFEPDVKSLSSRRKAWILTSRKVDLTINVDEGARNAVVKNSSLLAVGVIETEGSFQRGDCVSILCNGRAFACGITEYSSQEIEKIKGLKSKDFKEKLGYSLSKVIVHKNNLLLLGEKND